MNTTKRLLCLLLALVMMVCVFAGCTRDPADNGDPTDTNETTGNGDETGDNSGDDETTGDNGGDDETTGGNGGGETDEDPRKTDHHAPTYSFGEGVQEFVILSRSSTTYEFDVEAPEGTKLSGVDQAVFDRNAAVEERCNVEIVIAPLAGDWGNLDTFTAALRENNSLGTSQYDLVGTHQAYLATAVLEGYSWDFNQLPNLELSKVWWSEAYYNEVNYDGAIYMMYGDLAHTLYEYLEVMFFNEQMAEDHGIDSDDLYDLTLDGEWTFFKLKEFSELVTPNEDAADSDRRYAFLTNSHSQRSFLSSLGVDLAPFNADGTHEFPKKMHLSQSTPLQDFINFVTANPRVYCSCTDGTDAPTLDPIFAEGRALFYSQTLDSAGYLKGEMKQNYGVLPFPKYDTNQTNYVTGIRDTVTGVMVPYNCKNPEMSGTVTDMLSMYGYTEVVDVYYEEKLKYQSFNNPKCVQTLELIRDSFAPSFVMTFSHYMSFANSMYSGTISGSVKGGVPLDINGTYTSNVGTWRKRCRDLYMALDAIAAKRG